MKSAKIILPLLVAMTLVPTSAQAATANSSSMSSLRSLLVVPTSWFNGVGIWR